MQVRWPKFLVPLVGLFTNTANSRRQIDLPAAADFLFEQRPHGSVCADRTPGQPQQPGIQLVVKGQAPYLRTRSESLTFSHTDVPSLTIAANSPGVVEICGNDREDWSLRLCAFGEGSTETEAHDRLKEVSLTRVGSTVSVNGPGIDRMVGARGDLIAEAPAGAPTTVHSSFAAVQLHNMTGPVRVTAIHARATILNTTGRVDATGFVVDFAGSEGTVILSAEAEINLKFTTARFQGVMMAWAQRSVRVLVPRAFQTPFRVLVNRPQDFLCRTEFSTKVQSEKKDGLYVFTYAGDGSTSPERVHLRSEHGTVVVDTADKGQKSSPDLRQDILDDYT
jgi:hypothetical protein